MKTTKNKFDYGEYLIEYRTDRFAPLSILRKTINSVDEACKESESLKNKGYHDVLIRRNK